MTHPVDGESASRDRLPVVLRGLGVAAAVGLGSFAVWLIVTAETQKGTRVGALIGFWALLIAAFAVLGTRQPSPDPGAPNHDVISRLGGELARVEDAAARREYEYRLMEMLRREITATMSAELVTLRADVAALRSELVEKVGGQIRLERIETTRVIGSDIEALQHEVRQMLGGRQAGELDSFSLGSTHTSLMTTAEPLAAGPLVLAPRAAEPLRPEPIGPTPGPPMPPVPVEPPAKPFPVDPPAPSPFPVDPPAPSPFPVDPPTPKPPAPEPPAPEPITPSPVPPQVVRQETVRIPRPQALDPFASMPRLSRFTDFELDPIEPESTSESDDEPYGGRRRHDGVARPVTPASPVSAVNGSSGPAAPDSARHTDANGAGVPGGGGRRRRAADADDDLLARILNRESTR